MLISLAHKFVFIANLKVASTAIESVLRPFCEIRVPRSEWRKHVTVAQFYQRFGWIFDVIPRHEFVMFGCIREPLGFASSLYRSHRDPKFADDATRSTLGMSFDQFLDQWPSMQPDQFTPQSQRFVNSDGEIELDYIINYDKMEQEWPALIDALGLPPLKLPRGNVSVSDVDVAMSDQSIARVRDYFKVDQDCIDTKAGKWLRSKPQRPSKSKVDFSGTEPRTKDVQDVYEGLFGLPFREETPSAQKFAEAKTFRQLMHLAVRLPEFVYAGQRAISQYSITHERLGSVETRCTPEQLTQLLDHTRSVWTAHGRAEPFHSVLTNAKYKADVISDAAIEELPIGSLRFRRILDACKLAGFPAPSQSIVDWGCGVGRVGVHLAERVDRYIGVDISEPHLAIARERFSRLERSNGEFMTVETYLHSDIQVEGVFSVIVLQHNPPPLIAFMLRKMCRTLRVGGVVYFQVPTLVGSYSFDASNYLTTNPTHGKMHSIPQSEVFRLLHEEGMLLGRMLSDSRIGPIGTSYTFVAQKLG